MSLQDDTKQGEKRKDDCKSLLDDADAKSTVCSSHLMD